MDNLTLIRSIIWTDILAGWRAREAWHGKWVEHYKRRGYDSWDDWRRKYWQQLGLQDLDWQLFQITNPEQFISEAYLFPYVGWKKYYGEERVTFARLAEHPDIAHNEVIRDMIRSFPDSTTLIGLRVGDRLFIFEGTHRSTALALAHSRSQKISGTVQIAIADLDEEIFASYRNPSFQEAK